MTQESQSLVAAAIANEPYLDGMFQDLRSRQSPVMVEAGACDGYHTRVFGLAVPGLRQYAFEPDPRNFPKLMTIRPDGVSTAVYFLPMHFLPFALADVTGPIDFHLATPEPNGAIGSSSISEFLPELTAAHPWLREDKTVSVEAFRLDDFVQRFYVEKIDLLWLDVQGAERRVFSGLQGCWQRVSRIFTEFDRGYADSSTLPALVSQLNEMAEHDTGHAAWEVIFEVGGNALIKNRAFVGGNP